MGSKKKNNLNILNANLLTKDLFNQKLKINDDNYMSFK